MRTRWKDQEARRTIAQYRRAGANEDLALRVYTTRLLGRDPALVLHGGGNTSVKTGITDRLGKRVEVLCVQGSGWDMGDIEPEGLPAVRMDSLLELRRLKSLSDEDMVAFQRGALIDPGSPNPSVETLLHAFLPHKFIDHTHSTAVLSLTDQTGDAKLLNEVYDGRVGLVPYVKPGFDLAVAASSVYARDPNVEGLILRQHGIFTFGRSARESYERMVALVTLAEQKISSMGRKVFSSVRLPQRIASVAEVAPVLRGRLAIPAADPDTTDPKRMILAFRTDRAIRHYVDGKALKRYSQVGVATPDHTIRTKNWPLVVPAPAAGALKRFAEAVDEAAHRYATRYLDYFGRHNGKREPKKKMLDPLPRVILVPGLGLFGIGRSVAAAHVAADIAENTIRVVTDAEAIGRYRPVSEADMFDVEYWSLEQAKLGKAADPAFAGQVVIVTGGGSGIGAATARAFAAEGAAVGVLDLDKVVAEKVASTFGTSGLGLSCDVTNPREVRKAFDAVCKNFGGVDVVVSNAGAAWQGTIGEVEDKVLRASFELNFWAHQSVAQNAVRVMKAQRSGGALLFNVSKQAVNPGPDFGPYGLPKAATLFLSKQYALEYGSEGITSNAVNADRVNTGIFAGGFLEDRAAARGLTPQQYLRTGNLLQREVKASDVAKAFVDLAKSRKTTAGVITVDGGNIAASLR